MGVIGWSFTAFWVPEAWPLLQNGTPSLRRHSVAVAFHSVPPPSSPAALTPRHGHVIQGVGGSFVSGLDGCYFSVVGFPIHRFCKELVSLIEDGTFPLDTTIALDTLPPVPQ